MNHVRQLAVALATEDAVFSVVQTTIGRQHDSDWERKRIVVRDAAHGIGLPIPRRVADQDDRNALNQSLRE